MDYNIVKLYTEHLNMSSFKNSFDDDNIESLAKFNTSIIRQKQGKECTFLMEFTLRAVNTPIMMDWVGVGIVECEELNELSEEDILEDETVQEFIRESMDKLSFLLGGNLPNIIEEIR